MEIKSEVLVAFHQRLAALMNEIHKICISNNIDYTLMGGSLIGALRHNGFIPWDDDIDIGMTYPNYIKFINALRNLQHPWVEYDLANETENCFSCFIKIYDARTTLIEEDGISENGNGRGKGIFIDVFPISKAGKTKTQAIKEYKRHRWYQALLKRKGYDFRTGILREYIVSKIASFYSIKELMDKINRQYERLDKCEFDYSSDMDGSLKGIVPTRLFASYRLYPFEQYQFMGIKDADEYLKLVFGDYMQLPPEEKRKPHHVKYINLNMPYRDYERNFIDKNMSDNKNI